MIKKFSIVLFPILLNASPLSPDAQALIAGKSFGDAVVQSKGRSADTKVHGIILISKDFDESAFRAIGGTILSRSHEVCTVTLPYGSLQNIVTVRGITQFSPSRKVTPTMDSALVAGNAVGVYNGTTIGLHQSYTGKGVIVGIVDAGFDYIHPSFRDGSGNLRISRVWDQNRDGAPPSGYNYGTAFYGNEQIWAEQWDANNTTGHGTHVAGIAAGSPNLPSHGVAYDAELVFVSTSMTDNGIIDGIRWIFDYADSVGKPAVINLSLGLQYGPHDGTSAVDRIYEAYTGKGRILVGSAGNERGAKCHLQANLTGKDTVRSAVQIADNGRGTGVQLLSMWGDKGLNYTMGIELYQYGTLIGRTPFYSVSQIESAGGASVSLPFSVGNIDCEFYGNFRSPLNGKSEVGAYITSPVPLDHKGPIQPVLCITGSTTGTVHTWGAFGNSDTIPGFYRGQYSFVDGDTAYTIGEIGGTGRAIITAGAFTSKIGFTNVNGVNIKAHGRISGQCAPFSSVGPTVDNRIKPDISAPGDVIIAPFRRNILPYSQGGEGDYFDKQTSYNYQDRNGHWYPYGGISGTSMAAPFVTGSIALMLQANPNLTPQEVRTILQETANKDVTPALTLTSNDVGWGAGKIDVDAAVKKAESTARSARNLPNPEVSFSVRKNGESEMVLTGLNEKATFTIFDFRGRELIRRSVVGGNTSVILTGIASGTYVYRINSSKIDLTGKLSIR